MCSSTLECPCRVLLLLVHATDFRLVDSARHITQSKTNPAPFAPDWPIFFDLHARTTLCLAGTDSSTERNARSGPAAVRCSAVLLCRVPPSQEAQTFFAGIERGIVSLQPDPILCPLTPHHVSSQENQCRWRQRGNFERIPGFFVDADKTV